MLSDTYQVLAQDCECEYEVKKSRFIARLCRADSREQALQVLAQARSDFPDARHHCWAYMIGNGRSPTLVAMSDDGEPSGTAGKPILNVMQHKEVGDLMLVVIRYFGGIKLGAGGLVRAYSQAAQLVYEQAVFEQKIALQTYSIRCSFQAEQSIRHWLSQHQAQVESSSYSAEVSLEIAMATEYKESLQAFLAAHQASLQPPD